MLKIKCAWDTWKCNVVRARPSYGRARFLPVPRIKGSWTSAAAGSLQMLNAGLCGAVEMFFLLAPPAPLPRSCSILAPAASASPPARAPPPLSHSPLPHWRHTATRGRRTDQSRRPPGTRGCPRSARPLTLTYFLRRFFFFSSFNYWFLHHW